jgi:hypothetical protein
MLLSGIRWSTTLNAIGGCNFLQSFWHAAAVASGSEVMVGRVPVKHAQITLAHCAA